MTAQAAIVFQVLSWAATVVTALLLVGCFLRYRYLFIKPSFIVIAFFHLQIQWASALHSRLIFYYLPEPGWFALLVHGFPLIGLAVSFFIGHREAQRQFLAVTRNREMRLSRTALTALAMVIGGIALAYFLSVPLRETGLYAIFTNPGLARSAREASLKTLPNPWLRYGFIFLRSVLAPLLFSLLVFLLIRFWKGRQWIRGLAATGGMLFLLVLVSISGARSPALFLLLGAFFAIYLKRGMRISLWRIAVGVLLVVQIPVFMSLARSGAHLSLGKYWIYLNSIIIHRVIILPMEVALYHVHYAQTVGFFGVAAVPKLALLLGETPINVANFIFSRYTSYGVDTGLANACYVLTYYSYFGILTFPFALAGLWALDSALLVFRVIRNPLIRISAMGAVFTASLAFVRSDYTTSLITGGFLLVLAAAYFLDRLDSITS